MLVHLPCACWRLGPEVGVRGEGWGNGANCLPTNSLPFLLFLSLYLSSFHSSLSFSLSVSASPLSYSSFQALSLWVSFDLCSAFLSPSFPSLSPFLLTSTLPPMPTSTALPLPPPPCMRCVHTHYLLYCTFTLPFLCLNMFIFINSIVSELPTVFSTETCCAGL